MNVQYCYWSDQYTVHSGAWLTLTLTLNPTKILSSNNIYTHVRSVEKAMAKYYYQVLTLLTFDHQT